jgi:hypothetical protein
VKQVVDVAEFVQREEPAHVESGPHLGVYLVPAPRDVGLYVHRPPERAGREKPLKIRSGGVDGASMGLVGSVRSAWAELLSVKAPGPVFTAPPRAAYY